MIPDFSSLKEKEKYFHSLKEEQKTDVLNEMIEEAEHIAFLGGAGVSTESGIPDFRSKDGLYNKTDKRFRAYKPEYLLSYDCLSKKPEVFFDYYRKNLDCRAIEPNDAHKKLAEMEEKGKLTAVVTQNIDGLHQKAGSRNVYELHGSIHRNYCMRCGKFFNAQYIKDADGIPVCDNCGGEIKPDVVLYEEGLDQNVINGAVTSIR